MLYWTVVFFILAAIAAVLGFGGLAGTFAQVAQFLAVLFVIIFAVSLLYSLLSGRRPPPIA